MAKNNNLPSLELVKEYCLHRREVDFNATALHFTDIDTADLSRKGTLNHFLVNADLGERYSLMETLAKSTFLRLAKLLSKVCKV